MNRDFFVCIYIGILSTHLSMMAPYISSTISSNKQGKIILHHFQEHCVNLLIATTEYTIILIKIGAQTHLLTCTNAKRSDVCS